jgi:CheY-like chemotaxis protein
MERLGLKVLVVDDDIMVRQLLNRLLGVVGCDVRAAESGPAALEIIDGEAFDVALVDMQMRPMSGVETIRELRKKAPGLNVAIITGFATESLMEEARAEGDPAVLKKPFKINDIVNLLKEVGGVKA